MIYNEIIMIKTAKSADYLGNVGYIRAMITLRDRGTGDLFDRWSEMGEKRRRLLDCSWAEVFRNYLLEDLPIGELVPHFDAQMGRPSKDLQSVIGVLLLQHRSSAFAATARSERCRDS